MKRKAKQNRPPDGPPKGKSVTPNLPLPEVHRISEKGLFVGVDGSAEDVRVVMRDLMRWLKRMLRGV